MHAIGRSVWRFVEPGGIVADPGRALGYARVFDAGIGGWMNERRRERMVDLALLYCSVWLPIVSFISRELPCQDWHW